MAVKGKRSVEPENVEDSATTISHHRGVPMKAKGQKKGDIWGNMRRDTNLNRLTRNFFRAQAMPIRMLQL